VPEQGGGPGGLVGAQARGDGVEEGGLAVVEVTLGRSPVRGPQRGPPVCSGAPLVAQQRESRVRLDEALVRGDRRGEALLDAVLETQQATERGVVAVRRVLAGGEREAVGVRRPAADLAVQ
jgi:hypothetical protein